MKGLALATDLHEQMAGTDPHPDALDPATGTALRPSSQAIYDERYVRTTGSTITPTGNSTTTLTVTQQDGTTNVCNGDTTNGGVGIGTATPVNILDISGSGNTTAQFKKNPAYKGTSS